MAGPCAPCTCTRRVLSSYIDEDDNKIYAYSTEQYPVEELDVARFRCLKCGKITYYTGSWANFFEKGVQCPNSEQCFPHGPPAPPPFIPKAAL